MSHQGAERLRSVRKSVITESLEPGVHSPKLLAKLGGWDEKSKFTERGQRGVKERSKRP